MIHPEDRDFFLKTVSSENKEPHKPVTLRLVRKDGGIIWIEQTHTLITDEDGEPVAMHVIAHNITERRKVEKALDGLRRDVERDANLMPVILEAVKSYVTLGEICGLLQEMYGEYQELIVI